MKVDITPIKIDTKNQMKIDLTPKENPSNSSKEKPQ